MASKINVDGIEYIPVTGCPRAAISSEYVIVRTRFAGVFAGRIKSRVGQETVLNDARRLWYWDGAATLSQLAMEGTSKPDNCKFPCEVSEVTLMETIEILPMTEAAIASIQAVPVWSA